MTLKARLSIGVPAVMAELLGFSVFLMPMLFVITAVDPWVEPRFVLMVALTVPLLAGLAVMAVVRRERLHTLLRLDARAFAAAMLLAYLALSLIATALSADPIHSLVGHVAQYQGLASILAYAVAFVAAAVSLSDPARLRRLMIFAVGGAVLVAGYGIMQYLGYDPVWIEPLLRGSIFSTFGEKDSLGAYLAMTLPIAVALISSGPLVVRAGAAAAAAIIAIAMAIAFSRGAYVGAAAGVTVFVVATIIRHRSSVRMFAAIGAVAFALAIVVFSSPLPRDIVRIVDRAGDITDLGSPVASGRLQLWSIAWQAALDHPLIGAGPDSFPLLWPEYRDRWVDLGGDYSNYARYDVESPHNVIIATAVGAGIPALATYLLLITAVGWAGLRRLGKSSPSKRVLIPGLLGAAAAHFTTDLFMTADVAGSWIFWIVLGTLVAKRPSGRDRRAHPVDVTGAL